MKTLQNEPEFSKCSECPTSRRKFRRFVLGEGPTDAKLMIIGEAPGSEEERAGRPFVGQSGKLLNALLKKAGVDRSEVYVTNALKCRPVLKVTPKMTEACYPTLLDELAQLGCHKRLSEVHILVMGGTARNALFPGLAKQSVTSTVSTWKERDDFSTWWGKNVLFTWHPAYVLRNPGAVKDLSNDIMRWAKGKKGHIPTEVFILETVDDVLGYLNTLDSNNPVAIDLETSGFSPFADYVLCASISQGIMNMAVVFPGHILDNLEIKEALVKHKWIGHNAKFDSQFLVVQHGIKLDFVFDTMLASYCFDERRGQHGLKVLAARLFDAPDYTKGLKPYLKRKGESYALIVERGGRDALFTYAAQDAEYTWRLYEYFYSKLKKAGWLERPFGLIMDSALMYTDLEMRGVKVDLKELDNLEDRYTKVMSNIRLDLSEELGLEDFNPSSTKQVAHALYDVLGFEELEGRTTKAAILEELERIDEKGIVHRIREYRRVSKMRGTYARKLKAAVERDGDGRFHPRIKIHGTVTGRLSSEMIMVIPRGKAAWEGEEYGKWIKDLFVASDGMIMFDADYSQIELRLFGWYSKDPYLRKVYEDGRDLHSEVAKEIWGPDFTSHQRVLAKNTNFAYVYGGTEQSINTMGGISQEMVKQIVSAYNEIMPVAVAWREETFQSIKARGYVESATGRRRRFPLVTRNNARDVFKQGVNARVQSTASEITVASAVRLHKSGEFNDLGGKVLYTVHDSVVGECPIENALDVAKLVKQTMIDTPKEMGIDFPIKVGVDLGYSWGNMQSVEFVIEWGQKKGKVKLNGVI